MRILSTLFILLILTACSNQKFESIELTGTWWFCDSNQGGYTEISISDSTVRYLSQELFDSFPAIIKERSNKKIVTNIGFEISLIDKNTALFKGNSKTDTLRRIKEPVKKISDYDCNMNISRYEFNNILWHEFVIRSKNKKLKCDPIVLSRIKNRPTTLVTLDSTFFKSSNILVDDVEFTYEYRPKIEYKKILSKPSAYLTYNTDSSKILLKYSENGLCNDAYNIDSFLKKDGVLIVNTNKFHSGCSDLCSFHFYVLLEGLAGMQRKFV